MTFDLLAPSRLFAGKGRSKEIGGIAATFSDNLIVIASARFLSSPIWSDIRRGIAGKLQTFEVNGEPAPSVVDAIVHDVKRSGIDGVVIGVGGGSVLDTAKGVAAIACEEGSVKEYLEGVGDKTPSGARLPLIALPTTAGTGSEATKNAVLSEPGANGFKKSLRHDNYIPDIALLDPLLLESMPVEVVRACGLDALAQLLEGATASSVSPPAEALLLSALEAFASAFEKIAINGENDSESFAQMGYAAYVSGLSLSNVGLGAPHGLAGIIGGRCAIPHGIVCGLLLPKSIELLIDKIGDSIPNSLSIKRLNLFASFLGLEDSPLERLVEKLYQWKETLPGLSSFGIGEPDIVDLVEKGSGRASEYKYTKKDISAILYDAL